MNECDFTLDYGKSLVCKMQVWLNMHRKVEEQPSYECSLILPGVGCCCHKVQHDVKFHKQAAVFQQARAEGNIPLQLAKWKLYGGNVEDGLDSLRCKRLTVSSDLRHFALSIIILLYYMLHYHYKICV